MTLLNYAREKFYFSGIELPEEDLLKIVKHVENHSGVLVNIDTEVFLNDLIDLARNNPGDGEI